LGNLLPADRGSRNALGRSSPGAPFFSVIIVNGNGWHLLEECLESVYAQTFRDFETIVVDMGSSMTGWPGDAIVWRRTTGESTRKERCFARSASRRLSATRVFSGSA